MTLGEIFALVDATSRRPRFAFAVVLGLGKLADSRGEVSVPREELATIVRAMLSRSRWSSRRPEAATPDPGASGPDISRVVAELHRAGIIVERYYTDASGTRFERQGRGRKAVFRLAPEVHKALKDSGEV